MTNVGKCLTEKVPAATLWRASGGTRWRNLLYAVRPEPIPSFRGPIEDPVEGRLGICCSGGGIRSAAFNLGALQTLDEAGELKRATYVAAVSGGSYIAAAVAMVAKCSPPQKTADSNHDLIEAMAPFAPHSPEEQYLRNRSSYLAPTGMDKLYLAFRIVLGVIVLCRYRDYADMVATVGLSALRCLGFSPVPPASLSAYFASRLANFDRRGSGLGQEADDVGSAQAGRTARAVREWLPGVVARGGIHAANGPGDVEGPGESGSLDGC